MIDRRSLMLTAVAGVGLSTTGRVFAQTFAPNVALASLMDRMVNEIVTKSPETLTSLGMDNGANANAKFLLDDRSQTRVDSDRMIFRRIFADLKAIDRSALNDESAVHYDTMVYFGETTVSGYRFPYGGGWSAAPYIVSQLTGAYRSVPSFLDAQHAIATAVDAEAYLSRVSAFAAALDQETARMQADFAAGAVPPDFVIDRTVAQLATLTNTPAADLVLTTSIARRTAEKNIPGDWAGRAEAIVLTKVQPALRRQADALKAQRAGATHEAGCWRLPDGEAYYAYGIRNYTTTALSGDEIHRIGLEQLAELSARADRLLKTRGYTQGSVGQRIAALAKDRRYLYSNNDAGKAKLLRDLNAQMADMARRLPDYFGRIPTSGVEIRRIPASVEAGATGGSYDPPVLDGSRPGVYYINLRDTAEWPRFRLPTLTYHEASPGHHQQIALQQEKPDTPLLMKVLGFSAYSEGWGLYAEQLADEMGVYVDDPVGEIGYLQSVMYRATRLVVDSGLHAKRWSRERAIAFMRDASGDSESAVTTEIERYCVWPGQACSYKLGHNKWVELREASKAMLGERFDIKAFHDLGLRTGSVPLTVLERVITDWARAQKT